MIHENYRLKLSALGIIVNRTFWDNILCINEDYDSLCWKGECVRYCDAKLLEFPLQSNNNEVCYKKWTRGNDKRLVLSTLTETIGVLKETFLQKFSIYQTHIHVKVL